jgi:hypothetical protein
MTLREQRRKKIAEQEWLAMVRDKELEKTLADYYRKKESLMHETISQCEKPKL